MRIWNLHKFAAREMGYGIMNARGPFTPPPEEINPDYPLTLDLRRLPRR